MYRIGIDLGGTNIAVGLVDGEFKIVKKLSTPTLAKRPAEEIVGDMAQLCKKVCEECGVVLGELESIGIAAPGMINSDTGVVEYSSNLPTLKQFAMVSALRAALDTDVHIGIANDANAAAWGESCAGAAKGTKNNLMITLGTGVGGGIIIDGKLYTGFNFAGGELGHTVIAVDGVPCSCGRRGCWEAYSSATALVRMTREKVEECIATGRESIMLSAPRISGRTACNGMREGDEAATEVYNEYIKYLAAGITNMINIFQPEVISIGGGISGEGQSLIDSLEPLVRAEQYGGDITPTTELRIAALGNDAGIIGAAML